MSNKIVKIGNETRRKMAEGVNLLADAVTSTLGPGGQLVAMKRSFGPVKLTKDGVTVAREIEFKDPELDAGAKLCKQVAIKCNELAGDGTTTSTLLAQQMINEGLKSIESGSNPVNLKKGIDKAVNAVIDNIKSLSQPITLKNEEEVKFVATISGNNDEVGDNVSKAFILAGEDGVVSFEASQNTTTEIKNVKGLQYDRGFESPYFVTDTNKMIGVYEKPLILLWEDRIQKAHEEIIPLLKEVFNAPLLNHDHRSLVIFCDAVEGDALATIVTNLKLMGQSGSWLTACVVKAPGFGERRAELMEDMAILTGGKFFSKALGVKVSEIKVKDLGTAERIIVTAGECTIIGTGNDESKIEAHVNGLREYYESLTDKNDKARVRERIAKLCGGVSNIKIGASNETELSEKKDRYEDAVSATKAALAEGILPGAGTSLIASLDMLEAKIKDETNDDIIRGMRIVGKALKAPTIKIAENSGQESGSHVLATVLQLQETNGKNWGFNAATSEYQDLLKNGVIDPTKVIRLSLENAGVIAGLFLQSSVLVYDDPDSVKAQQNLMM